MKGSKFDFRWELNLNNIDKKYVYVWVWLAKKIDVGRNDQETAVYHQFTKTIKTSKENPELCYSWSIHLET